MLGAYMDEQKKKRMAKGGYMDQTEKHMYYGIKEDGSMDGTRKVSPMSGYFDVVGADRPMHAGIGAMVKDKMKKKLKDKMKMKYGY